MHELSIAQSIVSIILEERGRLGEEGAVERIRFQAGVMRAVIPDSLTFHFDVVKRDHPPLKESILEIEEIPLRIRCKKCGEERELHSPAFLCPACSGPVEILTGMELSVVSFDLED